MIFPSLERYWYILVLVLERIGKLGHRQQVADDRRKDEEDAERERDAERDDRPQRRRPALL